MNILVSELIWEIGIEELKRNEFSVDYDKHLGRNRDKLLTVISKYDALIVRNETKVDRELLEAGVNLKAIGRLGVGLDNIDLEAAKKKEISVVTARNANATSVAEYVMAAMLNFYRPLVQANEDVRSGNWNRRRFTGIELHGRSLGLVGLGEIAHRVAKRAKAFGLQIVGYDPFIAPYEHVLSETGVKRVNTVEELLALSDVISLHVPLTKATKNLINKETLSLMKPNAYLINTSRGGIIDETDLLEAIQTEKIAGACLDVLDSEPITMDSPLLGVEKICITPHIAGLTNESQQRTSILVAQEVANVLQGKGSVCAL